MVDEKTSLKKTLGWIFISFAVLCFISLTGLFGQYGQFFNQTGYGLFGQSLVALYCVLLIVGINFVKDRELIENKKLVVLGIIALILFITVFNFFTTQKFISDKNPGQYLASVANEGKSTAGGVVFSLLLCLPLCYVTNNIPIVIFLFAALFIVLFFMARIIYVEKKDIIAQRKNDFKIEKQDDSFTDFTVYNEKKDIGSEKGNIDGAAGYSPVDDQGGYHIYDKGYYESKDRNNLENLTESVTENHFSEEDTFVQSEPIDLGRDLATVSSLDISTTEYEEIKPVVENKSETVNVQTKPESVVVIKQKPAQQTAPIKEEVSVKQEIIKPEPKVEETVSEPVEPGRYYGYFFNDIVSVDDTFLETAIDFEGDYKVPSTDAFSEVENKEPIPEEQVLMYRDQIMESFQKLHYPAEYLDYIIGSSIIRYEFKCEDKNISAITQDRYESVIRTGLTEDLRTIHTRIPGKRYTIGIDIVNPVKQSISFKEMVTEKSFWEQEGITFVVGKNPEGKSYYCNVEELPHMLIAGASGSGKSVCMQSIVASLIYKNKPEDLRIVIIDTKPQDFVHFENTPHMLFGGVISDNKVALNALEYLKEELTRRNQLLKKFAISKISELKKRNCNFVLPKIVVLFDEYNDMLTNFPETQNAISDAVLTISAVGRAAGIHLIIATQRPAADVIDSKIRANLSSRIVLKVTDANNSSVALGSGIGGECDYKAHLLSGHGDLILLYGSIMENLQAPYVSEEDLHILSDYVKKNNRFTLNADLIKRINTIEVAPPVVETTQASAPASNFKKPIYQQIKREKMLSIFDFCAGTDQFGNVNRREVSYSVISNNITIGNTAIAPLLQWFTDAGIIAAPANERKKYFIVSREEFIKILDENGNE